MSLNRKSSLFSAKNGNSGGSVAMELKSEFCVRLTLLLVALVLPLDILAKSSDGSQWFHDDLYQDLRPEELDVSWSFPVVRRGYCGLACLRNQSCKSFFYNDIFERCLISANVFLSPFSAEISYGWHYYRKKQDCPTSEGYVLDPSSKLCFKLMTQRRTWFGARDTCSRQDARLVVLERADRRDFLMDYIRSNPEISRETIVFIGALRPVHEWNTVPPRQPRYIWLTGNTLDRLATDKYWAPVQPDNSRNRENVVALWAKNNFTWNDFMEGVLGNFICERPVFP